jgi:hypothetical protein
MLDLRARRMGEGSPEHRVGFGVIDRRPRRELLQFREPGAELRGIRLERLECPSMPLALSGDVLLDLSQLATYSSLSSRMSDRSSGSSTYASLFGSDSSASSSCRRSSKLSETYLRNSRPRTRCLYSAASTLPWRMSRT